MRRQRWVGVALVGFALAACGGPTQDVFGKEDLAAIQKLTDEFVAAYNAKDSAKIASLFTGTGSLMVPNSAVIRGPDPIKGYYELRFGQGATDLDIESAATGHGTLAYTVGTYSFRNAPPGGPETRDRGKLLWIVRRLPGNHWRLETVMWSSDLPPQVPPAAAPEK